MASRALLHERAHALERACRPPPGWRARRRATRLDHRLRARRHARVADAELQRPARREPSRSPRPCVNETQPPRAATAASMPLGLPWKTRSHAIARSCDRVVARARGSERARDGDARCAAEHPSPPPGGSDASTSTSMRPSDGDWRARGLEQRAKGAREVVIELGPRGRRCSTRGTSSRLGPGLAGTRRARAPRARCRPRARARRRRRRARRAGSPCRTRAPRRSSGSVSPSGLDGRVRAGARPRAVQRRASRARARLGAQLARCAPRRARARRTPPSARPRAATSSSLASRRPSTRLERLGRPRRRAAPRRPARCACPRAGRRRRACPSRADRRTCRARRRGAERRRRAARRTPRAPSTCSLARAGEARADDERPAHRVARRLQRVHRLDLAARRSRALARRAPAPRSRLRCTRASSSAAASDALGRERPPRRAPLRQAPRQVAGEDARRVGAWPRRSARASSPARSDRRAARRRHPSSRRE